jgi:hypothetical protein
MSKLRSGFPPRARYTALFSHSGTLLFFVAFVFRDGEGLLFLFGIFHCGGGETGEGLLFLFGIFLCGGGETGEGLLFLFGIFLCGGGETGEGLLFLFGIFLCGGGETGEGLFFLSGTGSGGDGVFRCSCTSMSYGKSLGVHRVHFSPGLKTFLLYPPNKCFGRFLRIVSKNFLSLALISSNIILCNSMFPGMLFNIISNSLTSSGIRCNMM